MGQVDFSDNRDLHIQVKDIILRHISKNGYKENSRLPSYRAFARMANVSAPTVQLAVESLVQEGVLDARRGKGTFVRMVPGVSTFKKKRIGLYACVVPTFFSNIVASRVSALDELVFSKNGNHMLLSNSNGDLQRDVELLDSLLKRDLDALIYQPNPKVFRRPIFARAINKRLQQFLEARIPVILLDWFPFDSYDIVVHCEKNICELSLQHFVELGHNQILFVVHSEFYEHKIRAFKEVCKKFNLTEKQIRFVAAEGDDPYIGAQDALSKVYDDCHPFTAIMASSDTYAIGCYRFLKSKGVRCPDDVSIIGADNLDCVENEFTRSLPIGLTTVWCEPKDVAQKIYEQIEFRLNEEVFNKTPAEVIEVTPRLVLRESTARTSLKF